MHGWLERAELRVEQALPGIAGQPNQFRITGASLGGMVTLVAGQAVGSSPIAGCPNAALQLQAPVVVGSAQAILGGTAEFTAAVPAQLRLQPILFQAWDAGTCATSAVALQIFL